LVTFPFCFKNHAIIEDAVFKNFIVNSDVTESINIQRFQEFKLKRVDYTKG